MVWDTFTRMKLLQNLIGSMVLKVSKSVTFAQKNAFLEFDKRDKKIVHPLQNSNLQQKDCMLAYP